MTIKQTLIWANKKLKQLERADHYDMPSLDAEILLAFTLKKPKEFLYSHPEKKLTVHQWNQFKKFIARRAKHEPVTYITNHKEFFGLDFFVNKHVMVPRPETEILVENALHLIHNRSQRMPRVTPKNANLFIVDVGSGSGCIIISLAKILSSAPNLFWSDRTKTGRVEKFKKRIKFFATDISSNAIKVARKNIQHHKVNVTLLRGNLIEPFLKNLKYKISNLKSLIIVANLPYLTTRQWGKTQPEIKKYEPRLALDGGPDGLKYHRKLLNQLLVLLAGHRPFALSVLLEIDPSQTKRITKLIRSRFPTAQIQIKKDLAGRDRVVIFHIQNN